MKRFYEISRARFRRWVYLMLIGMWHGECAYNYSEFMEGVNRTVGLASGTPGHRRWRVWWKDPDNSIMELQDYWVSQHQGFPEISLWTRWNHLVRLHVGKWWRRQRGITRLVGQASFCVNCNSVDYYHRLGCRCWREQQLPQDERILEWGWIMESPIQDQSFISNETILEWVKAGYHVELSDGKRVTLEDFEGEDV